MIPRAGVFASGREALAATPLVFDFGVDATFQNAQAPDAPFVRLLRQKCAANANRLADFRVRLQFQSTRNDLLLAFAGAERVRNVQFVQYVCIYLVPCLHPRMHP